MKVASCLEMQLQEPLVEVPSLTKIFDGLFGERPSNDTPRYPNRLGHGGALFLVRTCFFAPPEVRQQLV